jgi:hypothetical protein
MVRLFRTSIVALGLVTAALSAHRGKYWVCNHASHKTAKTDHLESQCMPETQAESEAAAHRKIHPENVLIFPCVM